MVISVAFLSKISICLLYYIRPLESAFQKVITIFRSSLCIRICSFVNWVTEDVRRITDLAKAAHEIHDSNRYSVQIFSFHCSVEWFSTL